ncbi:TetR/AcrR family transcriptional regulator [Sphingobium vermicomposti]|uniref:AcrR family transcriptional regulator n=1 Tax=Sphingobium vermicomposti TaxID=529005 RepID=A0A846M8K7_9SPHN|nr:TetR/AcrR family transcriptional regulator [Sphingobium vermicomposti]NIJ18202.1 AcrR family transcriptional regulator [Sphingobium vermicomposti]
MQRPSIFKPKRGRPTSEQVQAIEQAILTTARRMFLDFGFDNVAMEAVATASGVSKGTLYARHPSKEALLTAVIHNSVAEWSDRASQHNHLLTENIDERLHHHARIIADTFASPDVQALCRLMFVTQDRFPNVSAALHDVGYLYAVEFISKDIADFAIKDGIPARDPDSIAHMLVSAISGWQLQEGAARNVPAEELSAMAERFVELLLAARASW